MASVYFHVICASFHVMWKHPLHNLYKTGLSDRVTYIATYVISSHDVVSASYTFIESRRMMYI